MWHSDQKELRDRAKEDANDPKVKNSVAIPIDWLIESATKLRDNGAKVMHIIVTDKDRKHTLIHGKHCRVNIEGYRDLTATMTTASLGDTIGVCEEFPPVQWPIG